MDVPLNLFEINEHIITMVFNIGYNFDFIFPKRHKHNANKSHDDIVHVKCEWLSHYYSVFNESSHLFCRCVCSLYHKGKHIYYIYSKGRGGGLWFFGENNFQSANLIENNFLSMKSAEKKLCWHYWHRDIILVAPVCLLKARQYISM